MDDLIRQLKRWQACEFFLRLVWGVARLAAIVAVGLFIACSIDWIVDLYRDTPFVAKLSTGEDVGGVQMFHVEIPSPIKTASEANNLIEGYYYHPNQPTRAAVIVLPVANTPALAPERVRLPAAGRVRRRPAEDAHREDPADRAARAGLARR